MTDEQQQLLCAAILETVRRSFSNQYSDKASSLLNAVSAEWAGTYSDEDLDKAIDRLDAMRVMSKSKFSNLGLITINWFEARSTLLNDQMPALLNEYARFGENWLNEMWAKFMISPDTAGADDSFEPAGSALLPASDRLVPLDHNSASYHEVKEGLADLYEEVRSANDLECSSDERDRLLASLKAAQTLWDSAQLKIIQIQVGIIITIEDAIALLAKAGRAIGKALLIESIKSLVRHKTGVDL